MSGRSAINTGLCIAMCRGAVIMMMAGALGACAATKTYVATSEDNVRISAAADSGSSFTSTRAAMDVHTVSVARQVDRVSSRRAVSHGEPFGVGGLAVAVVSGDAARAVIGGPGLRIYLRSLRPPAPASANSR